MRSEMAYQPMAPRPMTLHHAGEYTQDRHSAGERNRLSSQKISDHASLKNLNADHRAAIHCVAWPLARRASSLLPDLRLSKTDVEVLLSSF